MTAERKCRERNGKGKDEWVALQKNELTFVATSWSLSRPQVTSYQSGHSRYLIIARTRVCRQQRDQSRSVQEGTGNVDVHISIVVGDSRLEFFDTRRRGGQRAVRRCADCASAPQQQDWKEYKTRMSDEHAAAVGSAFVAVCDQAK